MKNANMSEIGYHYCTVESFYKIISTSIIRFGNVLKMNDSTELRWLADVINSYVEEYTHNWDDEKRKEAKRFLSENLFNFLEDFLLNDYQGNKDKYICCFSEENDLLSQWRGYADDGHGVCIGFDLEALVNCKHHQEFDECVNNIKPLKYFAKIEYATSHYIKKDEDNKGRVRYITKKLEDKIVNKNDKVIIDEIYKTIDNIIEKNDINLAKTFIMFELMHGILFKNKAFQEEKEIRLICNVSDNADKKHQLMESFSEYPNEVTIKGPIFYPLKNDLKSCYEVRFAPVKKKIIKEIWIGPKCNIDNRDLRFFLENCGYDDGDIIIEHSKASYK
ncbi:DUF2971 domain-containing protein [Anaerocolumna jejuensis]|uniref:DUF2971 domain-containing protein n=1 Tax=Anaerocolumna jejuensis TaxID=259063 RepID=UPI000933B525|nr:DUF2971 domain-containing protein [Anaerocolumna jejuensis]